MSSKLHKPHSECVTTKFHYRENLKFCALLKIQEIFGILFGNLRFSQAKFDSIENC